MGGGGRRAQASGNVEASLALVTPGVGCVAVREDGRVAGSGGWDGRCVGGGRGREVMIATPPCAQAARV